MTRKKVRERFSFVNGTQIQSFRTFCTNRNAFDFACDFVSVKKRAQVYEKLNTIEFRRFLFVCNVIFIECSLFRTTYSKPIDFHAVVID